LYWSCAVNARYIFVHFYFPVYNVHKPLCILASQSTCDYVQPKHGTSFIQYLY